MTRDRIHFAFLNLGHFYDHLFILIFATVAALTLMAEWNMSYAELIPYSVPGFVAFGVAALPAGWMADIAQTHQEQQDSARRPGAVRQRVRSHVRTWIPVAGRFLVCGSPGPLYLKVLAEGRLAAIGRGARGCARITIRVPSLLRVPSCPQAEPLDCRPSS